MKTITTILLLVAFGLPVFGQDATAPNDRLLVLVGLNHESQLVRVHDPGIIPVHRLPDAILLEVTQQAALRLLESGIDFTMLDDHPWSESYCLLTVWEASMKRSVYSGHQVTVLLDAHDYQILKGDPESFAALRTPGVSISPIERVTIPIGLPALHLPSSTLTPNATIAEIIANVSDSAIAAYIQGLQNFGTRYWNNANRDTVSKWVRGRYVEVGFPDAALDSFPHSTTIQHNVVATLPGVVLPEAELIVGGHHDSYSSNLLAAPGADDNATGTAAAIEMSRVLKLVGYQPTVTLRFMGYAAEEAGLRGSASYAQRAHTQNRDIRAMLNYDMIGNRNQSQADRDLYVVWYAGADALSQLQASIARAYTTLTPVLTTSYRTGSDSYSFYQQGYPASFCIERDFSPYYHSPNDLIQYLDIAYATEVVKAGLATLLTLDMMPPTIEGLVLRDPGTGSTVSVGWDSLPVPDLHRYKVYVGRSSGVYDTSYPGTSRTMVLSGLTAGVQYFVGVSMLDLAGLEGMIVEQSIVPRSIPTAPVGLAAEGIQSGVRLTWRPNTELDLLGYNVYRETVSESFSKLNTTPIADTLWIDGNLTGGGYRYFATAADITGNESEPSDTVLGTPLLEVDDDGNIPWRFALHQNYPNPFNPTTSIVYETDRPGRVQLRIFDVLGREVAVLIDELQSPGFHRALWNAAGITSGVYFCRLTLAQNAAFQKLVLLR